MKTASAGLAAHMALGSTKLAHLLKIKRADGTVLGFTTHDQDLAYDDGSGDGEVIYQAIAGFKNSAVENKSDLSVDNLEIETFIG